MGFLGTASFRRTVMTKAIEKAKAVCKRKNRKEKDLMEISFYAMGGNNLFISSISEDENVSYVHHIYTLEEVDTSFAFKAKADDLQKFYKQYGKDKNVTMDLEETDGLLELKIKDKALKVERISEKNLPQRAVYKSVDPEYFYDNLTITKNSIGKSADIVRIGNNGISIESPIYFKRMNFDISLNETVLSAEHMNLLGRSIVWRKSDQKSVKMSDSDNELKLVFEANNKDEHNSFRQLFVFKNREELSFNRFNLNRINTVHTFNVDVDELFKLLSNYKASTEDVYLYNNGDKLRIDPYDNFGKSFDEIDEEEKDNVFEMDYEGDLKRTKVSVEGLRSLLSGYSDVQSINIEEFEDEEDKFHSFQIYTPHLMSEVLLKNEPNFLKMQDFLDGIIEQQKQIKYI